MKNFQPLLACKKNNFILHVFLEILQRYCKLVVFGTLGLSGYVHPKKWYCCFVGNFSAYLQAKNQLHPMLFCRYFKDMQTYMQDIHSPKMIVSSCERLWFLSTCKKNYIIHFLRYYILKNPAIWLAGSILAITRDPKFCQIVGQISITILALNLDYLQEKLTWQNFLTNWKNPIFVPFWALFAQIWANMNFPEKKRLSRFFNIRIIYHCAENQNN